MKNWYGSVENRIEENQQYTPEIKVGVGVTEYFWSDRAAYEVTQVIDQNHIFIRRMNAKRIDGCGMSEYQEYEYTSKLGEPEDEMVRKKNGKWYKVLSCTKENAAVVPLTENQAKRIREGKEVKKYMPKNISIGVMNEYYDFSF